MGLFGTVWGIMNAFRGLSMAQSSSIQAVAPGISEALIATAIGLAAAIPAVMAYNHFAGRVRVLAAGGSGDDEAAGLLLVAVDTSTAARLAAASTTATLTVSLPPP